MSDLKDIGIYLLRVLHTVGLRRVFYHRIVKGIRTAYEIKADKPHIKRKFEFMHDIEKDKIFELFSKLPLQYDRPQYEEIYIMLLHNSFDAIIDKMEEDGFKGFNGKIIVELYIDKDDVVLNIIDNGKTIEFVSNGIPKIRERDRKKQFGGWGEDEHRGTRLSKSFVEARNGTVKWHLLENGTRTETRMPRRNMPRQFSISKDEYIVIKDKNTDQKSFPRAIGKNNRHKGILGISLSLWREIRKNLVGLYKIGGFEREFDNEHAKLKRYLLDMKSGKWIENAEASERFLEQIEFYQNKLQKRNDSLTNEFSVEYCQPGTRLYHRVTNLNAQILIVTGYLQLIHGYVEKIQGNQSAVNDSLKDIEQLEVTSPAELKKQLSSLIEDCIKKHLPYLNKQIGKVSNYPGFDGRRWCSDLEKTKEDTAILKSNLESRIYLANKINRNYVLHWIEQMLGSLKKLDQALQPIHIAQVRKLIDLLAIHCKEQGRHRFAWVKDKRAKSYLKIAQEVREFIEKHKQEFWKKRLRITSCECHSFEVERRLKRQGIECDVFFKVYNWEGETFLHVWVETTDGYIIDACPDCGKLGGAVKPPRVLKHSKIKGDEYRGNKIGLETSTEEVPENLKEKAKQLAKQLSIDKKRWNQVAEKLEKSDELTNPQLW